MKVPRTVFGGRVRMSTLGLMASFVAVMAVWILIRPEPAAVTEEVVTVRTTKQVPGRAKATPTPAPTPAPAQAPAARPTRTPRPTPSPEASPKPTRGPSPTATPTSDGGTGGLLSPAPAPSRTPDGLF